MNLCTNGGGSKNTNVIRVLRENYQTCLSRPTHPTHARARMSLPVSLSPDARDGWMDAEWEEEEEEEEHKGQARVIHVRPIFPRKSLSYLVCNAY